MLFRSTAAHRYVEAVAGTGCRILDTRKTLPGLRVAQKYAAQFPKVATFTIDEVFGGWTKAQQAHFSDGGIFDQIYQPGTQ